MYKFLTVLPWIFPKVPQICHHSQSLRSFNFYGQPHCQERAGAVTVFNICCIIHLPPCLLPFLGGGRMTSDGLCLKIRRSSIKQEEALEQVLSMSCFLVLLSPPVRELWSLPKCVHGSVCCFSASSLSKISYLLFFIWGICPQAVEGYFCR